MLKRFAAPRARKIRQSPCFCVLHQYPRPVSTECTLGDTRRAPSNKNTSLYTGKYCFGEVVHLEFEHEGVGVPVRRRHKRVPLHGHETRQVVYITICHTHGRCFCLRIQLNVHVGRPSLTEHRHSSAGCKLHRVFFEHLRCHCGSNKEIVAVTFGYLRHSSVNADLFSPQNHSKVQFYVSHAQEIVLLPVKMSRLQEEHQRLLVPAHGSKATSKECSWTHGQFVVLRCVQIVELILLVFTVLGVHGAQQRSQQRNAHTNIVTRSRTFSGSWQMHLFVMTRMIHLCVYHDSENSARTQEVRPRMVKSLRAKHFVVSDLMFTYTLWGKKCLWWLMFAWKSACDGWCWCWWAILRLQKTSRWAGSTRFLERNLGLSRLIPNTSVWALAGCEWCVAAAGLKPLRLLLAPLLPWWPLLQTWACPCVSLCSSMSTGDWNLFLRPLEWARAETGGADRWVL